MVITAWTVGAAASVTIGMLALNVVGATGSDIQPPAPERAFETGLPGTGGPDPSTPTHVALGQTTPALATPNQPSPAPSAPARGGNASKATSTWPGTPVGGSAGPSPSVTLGPPRQFTTSGGVLTAECMGQLAYLDSWSPAPGYRVDDVQRGPATVAQVAFDSTTEQTAVGVSCASGFPQLVHVDE